MSAYRRGRNEPDYLTEVMHDKSRLWVQLMTRKDGRTTSKRTAFRALCKAWETGVANANNVGMRTREEIRDDAVERAFQWIDRLTDGLDGLSPAEAAVMSYVIAESERRGMLRVTCPGRAVAEFAKLSHRTAARTLASLTRRGLLVKHSPGRRGTNGRARAAIYGLPDPDLGT